VLPGPTRVAEDFEMGEMKALASQQSCFRRPWLEAEWRRAVRVDWICFVSMISGMRMEGLRDWPWV
jgi:hypothetical protein